MDPWTLVARTERSKHDVVNLWKVPALFHHCKSNPGNREVMSVGIPSQINVERYSIHISEKETVQFNVGDQVLVLVSTLTRPGCINGYPRIEAVEIASGVWTRAV